MIRPPTSKRDRLRLVVRTPQGLRRLAYIERRGDRAVQLNFSKPRNLEWGGRNVPVRDTHISVWRNAPATNAPGLESVHVHETYLLNDPDVRKVDNASVRLIQTGEFAMFVSAMTLPEPTTESILSEQKLAQCPVIELVEYDPRFSLLAIAVVITEPSTPAFGLNELGVNSLRISCNELDMIIFHTFFNMPSSPISRSILVTTSVQRLNDGDPIVLAGGVRAAETREEVVKALPVFLDNLMHTHFEKMQSLVPGVDLSEISNGIPLCNSARPFHKLVEERVSSFPSIQGEIQITYADSGTGVL